MCSLSENHPLWVDFLCRTTEHRTAYPQTVACNLKYARIYSLQIKKITGVIFRKCPRNGNEYTVMVPTLSDWQISLSFPVFSFHFPVFFFSVLFDEFNKYKNIFHKYISIKKSEQNKNWLKFPHFSSILGKIPRLFQSAQNSLTFPFWDFSRFSSPCGNHGSVWSGVFFQRKSKIKHK